MTRASWIAAGGLLLASGLWLAAGSRPPPAAVEGALPAKEDGQAHARPAAPDAREQPAPAPRPAPAAAPPAAAPAPAPAPDPAPWIDAAGEPSRALVRAVLEAALADHHPGHKLTPDEVERITDAALDLRAAQHALRELPPDPARAGERRALVERIARANATFAEILEMSFAEFTGEAGSPGAVDRDLPGEPLPPPEYLDDFR